MTMSPCRHRRTFLKSTVLGAAATILPWPLRRVSADDRKPLRFGVIADVHKDVMHDADQRLEAFVDRMNTEKVDFVMQMGDFCIPIPENDSFMQVWRRFSGPRYHVLGNHDTDGDGKHRPDRAYAFTHDETMRYWDMPARYYSFDCGGVHFVVLDGNEKAEKRDAGYYRYVLPEQAKWLARDLAATDRPTLVFIHQSLERADGGVENQAEIRAILEEANKQSGYAKVVACFSGHHHRDYVRRIGGIIYPQINSASYHWLGGDYQHLRYSKEIDAKYPYIKYTVPYKDPLYALVTIDQDGGFMQIEGTKSRFVGPAPWELGKTRAQWEARSLSPTISDWKIPV